METPARHSFTLDGTTRVFPIPSNIKGDNYVRLEVDSVVINDRTKYDIVNNAIVFNNAADVPSGSQLDVLVVQSEEAIGQLGTTSSIDIVAENIAIISNVNAVLDDITTNADNIVDIQNAEENAASALASKNAAATSATNANNSAIAAATSASNAASSATSASTSATTATTQATAAGTSATNASNSANAASTSASQAASSASAASTSASQAATSASSASTSATNASNSATSAATSVTTATTQAGIATTQAGIATTQAGNAASSASSASTSATNASTSADNASTSATEASTSATEASTSAANANTSALNAAATAVTVSDALAQVNNGNKDIFVAGTDFTSGTTTELTLSQTPAKSGFVHIFFDTDYQLSDTYTLAGDVVTFTSAIVATKVEVIYDVPVTLTEDSYWQLADARLREAFRKEKGTTIAPSLLLDFAGDKKLDPRITFNRASTATYYDGITTAKAEENLLVQSNFASSWLNANTTSSVNSVTAPDGTTTGLTLTSNSSVAVTTSIYQALTTAVGQTISVFAKAGTSAFFGITNRNGSNSWANFDLSIGVVASSSNCTPSISSVGNGWYRCVLGNATSSSNFVTFSGKDADPAASAWTTGTMASGNTIFIWGAQAEQRSTATAYTPTTTQPITNYIPQLMTAAADEARFDHDPITGESKGLLIEEQRTNLLTYSEQFDNAAWRKIKLDADAAPVVTANYAVSPNGSVTADRIVFATNPTASGTQVDQLFTPVVGTVYSMSFFIKSNTQENYNLILVASGGERATITVTPQIQRFTVSYENSSTVLTTFGIRCRLVNGADISVWGAQLEVGTFPTSYIPTVASQVTRTAERANIQGSNFYSWYNQAEGSFYVQAERTAVQDSNGVGGFGRILGNYSGNTNNFLEYSPSTNRLGAFISSATTFTFTGLDTSGGVLNNMAMSYNSSGVAASANGIATQTSTNIINSTVNGLYMFVSGNNTYGTTGHIKQIAYYPKRLPNETLQSITT